MKMEFENNLSFTDYSLESINISYTNIEIIIELENRYKIECENFISIDYIGQWDENIIDNIFVTSEDELIDLAKRKIQKNNNIHKNTPRGKAAQGHFYKPHKYQISINHIFFKNQRTYNPLSNPLLKLLVGALHKMGTVH